MDYLTKKKYFHQAGVHHHYSHLVGGRLYPHLVVSLVQSVITVVGWNIVLSIRVTILFVLIRGVSFIAVSYVLVILPVCLLGRTVVLSLGIRFGLVLSFVIHPEIAWRSAHDMTCFLDNPEDTLSVRLLPRRSIKVHAVVLLPEPVP